MAASSEVLNLDSLILSEDEKEAPLVVISERDDGVEVIESPDSDYERMAQECVASADMVLDQAKAEREEKNRRINQARMQKQREREEKQKGFSKKSAAKTQPGFNKFSLSCEPNLNLSNPNSSGKITGFISAKNNFALSSQTRLTKESNLGSGCTKTNRDSCNAPADISLKNNLDSSSCKKSNFKKSKTNKKPPMSNVSENNDVSKQRNITIQDFDVSSTDTYSDYESDSDMDLDRTDLQFVKKQPKLFTVRHLNDVANLDVDQMFDSDSSQSDNEDNRNRCYYSAEKSANAKRRYKSNYLNKRRSKFKSKSQNENQVGTETTSVMDSNYLCPSASARTKQLNKKSHDQETKTGRNKNYLSSKEARQNHASSSNFGKNKPARFDCSSRGESWDTGRNSSKNFIPSSQYSTVKNVATSEGIGNAEQTVGELDDFIILSEVYLTPDRLSNDQSNPGHSVSGDLSANLNEKEEDKLNDGLFELDRNKCKDSESSVDDIDLKLDDYESKECRFEDNREMGTSVRLNDSMGVSSESTHLDSILLKSDEALNSEDKSDELFKFEKGTNSSDDEIDWKAVMENRKKAAVAPKLVLSSDSEDIDFDAIIRSKKPPEKPVEAGVTRVKVVNDSDSSDLESQFKSCLAQFNKK